MNTFNDKRADYLVVGGGAIRQPRAIPIAARATRPAKSWPRPIASEKLGGKIALPAAIIAPRTEGVRKISEIMIDADRSADVVRRCSGWGASWFSVEVGISVVGSGNRETDRLGSEGSGIWWIYQCGNIAVCDGLLLE